MTASEVMKQLESMGTEQTRKTYRNHGCPDPFFGVKVGDLVSGEGHLVCGKCRNCLAGRRHLCRATVGLGVGRDGAFAEYVALPAANSAPSVARSGVGGRR